MNAKVQLRSKEVRVAITNATAETLERAAFAIEGETKMNIRDADLIDTGFMVNSVYAIAPNGNSSGGATSGTFQSKDGQTVTRKAAPKVNPPNDGAVVAIGAEYAIYQETQHNMLYNAAESVAKKMGGIVKKV